MKEETDKKSQPGGKNALEWIVFALASVLVLAVGGILAYEAAVWEDQPARLEIETGEPVTEGGHLYLPVTVNNRGGTLAVNVNVRVTARGTEGERSVDLRFDFIPRGASREGRAAFPPDQDPAGLEARLAGYELP